MVARPVRQPLEHAGVEEVEDADVVGVSPSNFLNAAERTARMLSQWKSLRLSRRTKPGLLGEGNLLNEYKERCISLTATNMSRRMILRAIRRLTSGAIYLEVSFV